MNQYRKSLIINHKSQTLKRFVNEFNFPNPDWSTLPKGFPNLEKDGLTKQEGHLMDGIKLAWIISGGGRQYFYKTAAKRAAVAVAIVFVLFAGKNLITSNQTYTKTVNATTVTAAFEEIIESTRSAIFKGR